MFRNAHRGSAERDAARIIVINDTTTTTTTTTTTNNSTNNNSNTNNNDNSASRGRAERDAARIIVIKSLLLLLLLLNYCYYCYYIATWQLLILAIGRAERDAAAPADSAPGRGPVRIISLLRETNPLLIYSERQILY